MERLMEWDCDNQWYIPKKGVSGNQVHNALAAFEHVCGEKTPDEIKKALELLDAEEQGLLLRLPCKVGDTVYQIVKKRTKCSVIGYEKDDYSCQGCEAMECDSVEYREIVETKAHSLMFIMNMSDGFGKTVFLTRETAEEALKSNTPEIRGSHAIDTGNPLTASIINTMVEAGREALNDSNSLDSK